MRTCEWQAATQDCVFGALNTFIYAYPISFINFIVECKDHFPVKFAQVLDACP